MIPGVAPVPVLRASMSILAAIHPLDGGPRPETVATGTASYSDIVFGMFAICGYRFSPRIAFPCRCGGAAALPRPGPTGPRTLSAADEDDARGHGPPPPNVPPAAR